MIGPDRSEEATVGEARLAAVESGQVPAGEGWFVVNAGDAAWVTNDDFGARCVFEASHRTVGDTPGVEARPFAALGLTLAVVPPGRPSGLYHAESAQEDFLVLAGECLLLVEGEERPLRAWDFVHCPPGTPHCFVAVGVEPCVLLMLGARSEGRTIAYPRDDTALRHGAGVEVPTNSPGEAYGPRPHWRPGHPAGWDALPWAGG